MAHVYRLQLNEPGKLPRVLAIEHEVEIGRDCDGIVVDDGTASRRHARLQPTDAGLVVSDLGSSNGTWVDGEQLGEPRVVKEGASIQIGETVVVVHPGRPEDSHAVEVSEEEVLEGERPSSGVRQLSRSSARTARPGGSVSRPHRE